MSRPFRSARSGTPRRPAADLTSQAWEAASPEAQAAATGLPQGTDAESAPEATEDGAPRGTARASDDTATPGPQKK